MTVRQVCCLGLFLASLAYADLSIMQERAQVEKWTFTFDEGAPDREMGFRKEKKKDFSYEDTSELDLTIPNTYDLRDKLSPIQAQGKCGSCWAFSLTAALQDALLLYGTAPAGQLSQQYLVDCATNNYGCNGGTFEAAKFLVSPKGAPLLTDYPYTSGTSGRATRCQTKPVAGSLVEWKYVGKSSRSPTIEEIQKAILQYGEVSVTVAADRSFIAYKSGVYNACSGQGINHMIDLVGWDNEGTTADANGKYPSGHWIVRNSWGTGWGESGWGRVSYTNSRTGRKCSNIADEAVLVKVVLKPEPAVTREFSMESTNLNLKVTLTPENKLKVDEAKSLLKTFLDNLDKE